MQNAESKMQNARAEWCVECGKLVIKAFYIAYFFAPAGSINFFVDNDNDDDNDEFNKRRTNAIKKL